MWFDTVQPKPMSLSPICRRVSNVRSPLSKPPCRPRSSSFFSLNPSIDMRMPILGNLLASSITRSSYQPDVDITMRGVCRKHSSTISGRSSRMNGSPPVRLINLSFGSERRSAAVSSSLRSVGFCHMLHIWHRIGQRYVSMIEASVGSFIAILF